MRNGPDVSDFSEELHSKHSNPAIQHVESPQYLSNKDLPENCQEKEPYNRTLEDTWCCWEHDGITFCYVSCAIVGVVALSSLLWVLYFNQQKAIHDSNDLIESLECTNNVHTVMKGLEVLSGIQAAFILFAVGVLGFFVIRRGHDKRGVRLVAGLEIGIFVTYLIFAFWEIIEFYQLQGSSSCKQAVKTQSHYWTMFCLQNYIAVVVWSLIGFILSYIIIASLVNRFCPIAKCLKNRNQRTWDTQEICNTKIDFAAELKRMEEEAKCQPSGCEPRKVKNIEEEEDRSLLEKRPHPVSGISPSSPPYDVGSPGDQLQDH